MRPFLRFLLWIEVRKHPFFDLRAVGNPEAVVVDFHLRAGQKESSALVSRSLSSCAVKSVIGQDRILCTASARSSASIAPSCCEKICKNVRISS